MDLPFYDWIVEIPVISRTYMLLATTTSILCSLDLISPLNLYFNARLILKGQVWRVGTNFLFFGTPGLDFCLHLYFLVRYCRLLEESPEFEGKTADFLWLFVYGVVTICLIGPFLPITFFGSSLSFMTVYIWSRRNEHVQMSFLGLFPFRAPLLPWVLMSFSAVVGSNAVQSVMVDGLGIVVGHVYYFLQDVYPKVAKIRELSDSDEGPMRAPRFLRWLFGELAGEEAEDAGVVWANLGGGAAPGAAAAANNGNQQPPQQQPPAALAESENARERPQEEERAAAG